MRSSSSFVFVFFSLNSRASSPFMTRTHEEEDGPIRHLKYLTTGLASTAGSRAFLCRTVCTRWSGVDSANQNAKIYYNYVLVVFIFCVRAFRILTQFLIVVCKWHRNNLVGLVGLYCGATAISCVGIKADCLFLLKSRGPFITTKSIPAVRSSAKC